MTDNSWKLKGLSVSLLLLMVGIVSWFYWQPERLIRPSQTNTVDQVVRHRMQKNTQAVLIFYQPGCRDCRKIAPQVLTAETKNYFSGAQQLVNVNTQAAQNRRYLKQFKIATTPTLIRYQHGQVTRYSGTNLTTIKHLLSGK